MSKKNSSGAGDSYIGSSGLYSVSPEDMRVMVEEAAGGRTAAHAEQTWGRFVSLAVTSLEDRNIFTVERECVDQAARVFLRVMVRCLDAGSATNFIAQLPKLIQEPLLSEPAGPDNTMCLELAARALKQTLGIKQDQAADAVAAMAETVASSISPGEVEILATKLPQDLATLLVGRRIAA